jgi:hypothetical protein
LFLCGRASIRVVFDPIGSTFQAAVTLDTERV